MFLEIYYRKERKDCYNHLLIDTFGSNLSKEELIDSFLLPFIDKNKPYSYVYDVYSDISEYYLKSKLIFDSINELQF